MSASVSSAAGFEADLASPQNCYSLVAETLSSTAGSLQPSAVGLFAAVALPVTAVNQQASLLALSAVMETPFVVVAAAAVVVAVAVVVAAVAGAAAVVVAVTAAAADSVGVAAVVATAGTFAVGRLAENYPLASLAGPW